MTAEIHLSKLKHKLHWLLSTYDNNRAYSVAGDNKEIEWLHNYLREFLGFEFKQNTLDCSFLIVMPKYSLGNYLDNSEHRAEVLLFVRPENKKKILEDCQIHGYRLETSFSEYMVFSAPKRKEKVIIDDEGTLSDIHIQQKLSTSERRLSRLEPNAQVEIFSINPKELLVPLRFDIAIKLMYAKNYILGRAKNWREYAYKEHIKRITGRGNEAKEFDGTGKEGYEQYIEAFNSLLSCDIDISKIPVVPCDTSMVAFDGSHRIASAIAKNRKLQIAKIHAQSKSCADYNFFSTKKNGHLGCNQAILDEAALEYMSNKQGLSILLVFPVIKNPEIALHTIQELGEVVYVKSLPINPIEGGKLLKQVYYGHDWFNQELNSSGFRQKQLACFKNSGELRVILIDNIKQEKIQQVKSKIRDEYGIGNHSIHMTDSDDETLEIAQALFNNVGTSLVSLFSGNTNDVFHQNLLKYKNWLETCNYDSANFAVCGSALLGLFGLREVGDIDFLYFGDESQLGLFPEKVDCHNKLINFYGVSTGDIVADPRLHFWYLGVKFCSLDVIITMKTKRNIPKDKRDIRLLSYHCSSLNESFFVSLFSSIKRSWAIFLIKLEAFWWEIKKQIYPMYKKIKNLLN